MKITRILFVILAFAAVSAAQTRDNWITGVWEGTGYQIDSENTWTMRLTASDRGYTIEYPSLKCSGVWRIVSLDDRKASFVERISTGKQNCQDDGNVVIERLGPDQIAFRYSYPNSTEVTASAILARRSRR